MLSTLERSKLRMCFQSRAARSTCCHLSSEQEEGKTARQMKLFLEPDYKIETDGTLFGLNEYKQSISKGGSNSLQNICSFYHTARLLGTTAILAAALLTMLFEVHLLYLTAYQLNGGIRLYFCLKQNSFICEIEQKNSIVINNT